MFEPIRMRACPKFSGSVESRVLLMQFYLLELALPQQAPQLLGLISSQYLMRF